MSKSIRVGIIGTGIFARRHMRAYAAVGKEKFEIVACANRSRDKAEAFAKEAGIPLDAIYINPVDLINDPRVDLVDVVLPIQFNREIVKAAIDAGKHVMMEKPIATNLNDARSIVRMAKEAKPIVAIAENWAYHPLVQNIGRFIAQGGIGKIVNFTYDSARPYNPDSPYHSTSWRQNPEHPGGYLSDGCVHDLAHLIPILGQISTVSAATTKTHKIHVVEDTLATTVCLANGGIGVANFTFCSAGVKRMTLVVHGTEGTIRLVNDNEVEWLDAQGQPKDVSTLNPSSTDPPFHGFSDVEGELANLHDAIMHGAPLAVTPGEAFHHLAFVVAALESDRTGKMTRVECADDPSE